MLESCVLDVIGQAPSLYKLYTQITCIFPVPDVSSHDAIVNTLTNGLDRLAESFPWLSGQVINEGASDGDTGVYKIVPLPKIPLVVKDLRDDLSMPTMDTLRESNFPISMLDENIVAPCMTLNMPGSSVGLAGALAPVFCAQATFIQGGLILTLVAQHNTMDMMGQGQAIHLFSKACHNEPFTDEELSSGNLDRTKVIPLLDDSWEPGPELANQIMKPPEDMPTPPPPSKWAYITFSADSLAALKTRATKSISPPSVFVSTDDTVSAFIWQCICRARLARLEPSTKATFARAVDVRKRMSIPSTYAGMLQNMEYHSDTLHKLADAPLGSIASSFRSALDPKTSDLAYRTRALATFLSRSPDKNVASFTASVNIPSDFMMSSWAKINCYDLDFNLGLGKPESVRRPQFAPFESLGYLMPRSPAGEMAAAICLRDEDWERVKVDEEFVNYATYVG